jgi:hypothetical protein
MGFYPVAVALQQDTSHKTTQTMKYTLETMNTMQIQLQLQLIEKYAYCTLNRKIRILYTKECTHISPRPSLHSTSLRLFFYFFLL